MKSEPSVRTKRPIMLAGVAAVAIALLGWWIASRKPPQMGAEAAVFANVDALFTAVTAHDEKLLAQCERRLHALKAEGKCPAEASDYLDAIIQKSRAGRWQSAAERLYEFMRVQRRDGASDLVKKKQKIQLSANRK